MNTTRGQGILCVVMPKSAISMQILMIKSVVEDIENCKMTIFPSEVHTKGYKRCFYHVELPM